MSDHEVPRGILPAFDPTSDQPTAGQIIREHNEYLIQLANRVIDVFENADEDALAEEIQQDIYEAIGLLGIFGVDPEPKGD